MKGREVRRDGNPEDDRLLGMLSQEPLAVAAIVRAFGGGPKGEESIRARLAALERTGRIVRVRGDHYVVPQAADLFTGRLQIHAGGSGHVLGEAGAGDLFIAPENLGTALNGDLVVARLIRQARDHGRPRRDGRKEGRILRVVERCGTPIVGTLQKTRNFLHVVADDPRFPRNLYVPSDGGAKPGDKVVARLDSWENSHVNPEGSVVEVLGPAGAPGVDMLSVIRKHNLPRDFPAEVVAEAERFGSVIRDSDLEGREDLRGRPVITIDPDDARDFDDAIEVTRIRDGWGVAVHIADVSHYVRPGPASSELATLCEHISTTERAAADAEKESVRLKKLEYFSRLAEKGDGPAPTFEARVVEARNYGLMVELPESLITGLVPVSSMGDDFYIFDATRSRLVGRNSRRVHRAGDMLRVQVARVDTFKQQIDFRIASERGGEGKKEVRGEGLVW